MKFADNHMQRLRGLVDQAVSGPHGIPGATFVVFGQDGSEPFAYSAGKRGLGSSDNMTLDSVFWTASCTKLVTAICCMRLVDQCTLRLDDSHQLDQLCPELRRLEVLKADGSLEPQKRGITLRMLLTHTAGFGYSFANKRLRDWTYPAGLDEFSGDFEDMLQPLLFQPGESWLYGISMDWAGLAVERATKTRLNDYIQTNICSPLGLRNVEMMPNPAMKSRLAYMHQRLPDGSLAARDHIMRRPLVVESKPQRNAMFHSGGAGLFAKPQEFCRILGVLLNKGTCPLTGVKLLLPGTVDEMFKNQIPNMPHFARRGLDNAKPDLMNPIAHLYPTEGDLPQGWGLSFMLTGGGTGRSPGTAWWAGIANCFWWLDRENGVGGLLCTQILPFGDPAALPLWLELETAVYQALEG